MIKMSKGNFLSVIVSLIFTDDYTLHVEEESWTYYPQQSIHVHLKEAFTPCYQDDKLQI